MASEATHVRFAKDLAETLSVRNKADYYAGCVYPDSRYVTGLLREKTHGAMQITPNSTDFEKGWVTHLMYDKLLRFKYLEGTPWQDVPVKPLSDAWIYLTASKFVEDLFSFDALGEDVSFLQTLACPLIAPNQEEVQSLERYYAVLRAMYQRRPELDDYFLFCHEFGIPREAAEQIVAAERQMMGDAERMKRIEGFYGAALVEGKEKKVV